MKYLSENFRDNRIQKGTSVWFSVVKILQRILHLTVIANNIFSSFSL